MPKANLDLRGNQKDEENKEKAKERKNTITHRCSITFSMVIHDRIFMCHCRYRTSFDWYDETGNHKNHRIEHRRVWQLRYEKEHRKEEVRKDEIIRRHIRLIHGASRRIHGTRQVR